jgi:hypothetical protein
MYSTISLRGLQPSGSLCCGWRWHFRKPALGTYQFSIQYRFSENRAVYDHNVEKYARTGKAIDHNKIRRMRFACWITKASNTHSENAILTAVVPTVGLVVFTVGATMLS